MLVRVQVTPSAPNLIYSKGGSSKTSSIASSCTSNVNSCLDKYAKSKHKTKNILIRIQVSFERKFDGPSGPNNESELPPPKAEPKSDPFPCCNMIEPTINTARTTNKILINMTALY